MHYPKLALTGVGIAGLIALAACGSGASTPSQAPAAPAAGEVTVGESVPHRYTDAKSHYVIDAPGLMTSNANGTASYIGPSERMEIAVVTGSGAADPAALAGQDAKSLAASLSGFRQVSSPSTVSLNGRSVTKFTFTWNAGTSAVTGKAVELTSVRYYVPKDSATLAVITYGIVSNQFDPQGADDLASTFRWQ
jgi:hypothetical protein